jgi:predicted MFS family arabinose efflux permease
MRRNIILLNLAAAFIWLGMYSYVPTLPSYAASIGADVVMIGLLGGVYGVMQIILRIPIGMLSDRFGRDKALLAGGFVVLAVSNLIFSLQPGRVGWLIAARAIAGAAAAWWVVICTAYSRYFPDDRQVQSQGVLGAAANVGKVVASLLCMAAAAVSYRTTFVVALVAAVIGAALMLGLKEPSAAQPKPVTLHEQFILFKNRDLIIFCIFGIVSQFMCFAIPTTFTLVVAENAGAASMHLSMLMLLFWAGSSVGSLFAGSRPYNRLGGVRAMALSFGLSALCCLPIFYRGSLAALYILELALGACYGIQQGALSGFVMLSVPPAQRGAAMGIFQALFGVGILTGPVITGYVIDAVSYEAAYGMMAVVMAASAALCRLIIPRKYERI